MKKVIVGMSGGVDSSVTACLLKEEGYEVEGVSFILWEARARLNPRTCCSLDAIEGAKETAELLGIRHRAVDVRDDFMEKVIDPFVDAYLRGLTPNPCILCNIHIKFPCLLREAEKSGAEFIATGHYSRIQRRGGGYVLMKGVDPSKDQSYFLYVLKGETMKRLIFPLGTYRKDRVREIARDLDLPAVKRPESVEICFIEEDYSCFIRDLMPEASRPGPIIGPGGEVLGTHRGIYNYTMGQRRGLNIAHGEPLYVRRIDAERNEVHVGPRETAFGQEVVVGDLNWITGPVERITARIRSMMRDEPASLYPEEGAGRVRVVFDEPQWAPAPGQSVVFYDGDLVIGGGIIQP